MKKFIRLLIAVLFLTNGFLFAQKTWTGAGDGSSWSDANNWNGSVAPVSTDQVLLNNSNVSDSYTVYLPTTAVSIVRLTITPSTGKNITLILPNTNTVTTNAFQIGDNTSATDDVILNDGAILKNSSGATSGTPMVVYGTGNGTLRINNGGHYIHNTLRGGTTGWADRLSSVSGTENGTFEFDVPYASASSFSPSASGRTYGNITFTNNSGFAGTYTISGSSAFTINGNLTINSNATLTSSMTGGLTIKGNLTHNGVSLTIPSGQATTLSGSSTQAIGGSNAVTFGGNLTINNSSGVTLGQSISLGGTLTLTSGNITTGSNILTIASGGSVSRTSGYIIGSLKKNSVTGSQIFDVGTSSGYTPVSMIITGTGDFTVQTVSGKHPNAVGSNVLGMYWTLTNGGITSANLQFTYLASDVTGTESNYVIGKYSSGIWSFPSTSLNTGTHTASTSGVSSFSDFTLGENSALPVELTSFTSNVIGNKVELNWKTATEVNNYGFEIERLAVSNQQLVKSRELNANSWVKIGFVEGNGNSNSPRSYSFTDEPTGGKEFNYRLKQIDNDGTYEYSGIITAALENVSAFVLEQNYPNPFNPTTMISYTIPERVNVKLKIYDMIAQQVAELVNSSQEAGHYQVTFDGSDLPSGVYFYKLEAGNFVEVKKFMLVK